MFGSVLDLVGGTPLVRLARLRAADKLAADIALKLEFFNPLGSVKDRIGLAMVEAAELAGAIARADAILARTRDAWIARQFDNPANPAAHQATTAEEIWVDTAGAIDFVVGGIGTGGTLTPASRAV